MREPFNAILQMSLVIMLLVLPSTAIAEGADTSHIYPSMGCGFQAYDDGDFATAEAI